MTQLTDHAKSILRAIADGKDIQERNDFGDWVEQKMLTTIAWNIVNNSARGLRIAPENRSINGVTFAAPVDYKDENCLLSIGVTNKQNVQVWFVQETALKAELCAIIDALEGRTK